MKKTLQFMKCVILFLCLSISQLPAANVYSQNVILSINAGGVSSAELINTLLLKTDYSFILNTKDIENIGILSIETEDKGLTEDLDKTSGNINLCCSLSNNTTVFSRKQTQQEKIVIKGQVTDKNGEPLPGVTIVSEKARLGGAVTNDKGEFVLEVITSRTEDILLTFSFIGMKTQTIKYETGKYMQVVMQEDKIGIDEVVVNGYFNRKKETFTGAITTISGAEIMAVSNTNLIQTLAALTPGMHLVENNAQGSDPNAIPQIIIRGTTSLIDSENLGANNPLIVLDGNIITIEELYDLDLEDIDRIDVLKDAAATSIYGDEASNGVIVVTRKRAKDKKLRVRYRFTPDYSIPDIRSINLTNAKQKLELERLAGLYDKPNGELDIAYRNKLMRVNNGVNTDWISKPLRVSFSHNHSISLTGRANLLSYRISANLKDAYGVMKGDNRRNGSMNFFVGYYSKSEKLRINFRSGFSLLNAKKTPYGDFAQYTILNPYEPVRDEFGDYIPIYYFNPYSTANIQIGNPLYNASLSSFNKQKSMSITNSLNARWEIGQDLIITSQLNYKPSFYQADKYISPDNSSFLKNIKPEEKGSYNAVSRNGYSISGKLGVNYRILFDKKTAIRFNAGAEFRKRSSNSTTAQGEGFKKDWMSDLRFALNTRATGYEIKNSSVGFYGSANFSYKQKYNLDLNIRTSGSSKYGSNNQWGPFWSGGVSWNLHKEPFLNFDWLTNCKIRVSTGYTGSSNFNPYQAITVYQYLDKYVQYTGIGAVPKSMGNPNLKWQRTLNTNYGFSISLFENKYSLGFDYYVQNTKDVIMSLSFPPSTGTKSVKVNYGEILNQGYDIHLSAKLIDTKDFFWSVSLSGSHVNDRLEKLSEDVISKNIEFLKDLNNKKPKSLLIEGGSQYDIYGVRSAGIDPATGKEIYIDNNGNYTFDYDVDYICALGNTNPKLRGSISSGFRYKNFSVNITSQYSFGGDKYNSTIYEKVENINPYQNVDERAFTQRWKKPGDLKRFLGIQQGTKAFNRQTSRFVERFNEWYISNINFAYVFRPKFLKKIGVKKLRISYGMTDVLRLSTMKYERGTSYPYARRFNISIKPTF